VLQRSKRVSRIMNSTNACHSLVRDEIFVKRRKKGQRGLGLKLWNDGGIPGEWRPECPTFQAVATLQSQPETETEAMWQQ
jgi:hypothetical protein